MSLTFPDRPPIDWYAAVALAGAIALGLFAARHPTRTTIAIAAAVGAIVATTVLYAGQLALPLLYFVYSRRQGRFIGWSLLIAALASPPILYWRMPWPRPLPPDPTSATASVVNLRSVNHVAGGRRTRGQGLRIPVQIATLTLTPASGGAPITVTDTIDSGSVAALQKHATIFVVQAPLDPGSARIAAATRNYAADLWRYIMEIVYGTTLAAALGIAALDLVGRLVGVGRPVSRRRGPTAVTHEGIPRPPGR